MEGGYGRGKLPYSAFMAGMFIDPRWWQCLGQGLGWDHAVTVFKNPAKRITAVMGGEVKEYIRKAHTVVRPTRNAHTLWKRNWHRFIDHLIAGKDAESFFNELLK